MAKPKQGDRIICVSTPYDLDPIKLGTKG